MAAPAYVATYGTTATGTMTFSAANSDILIACLFWTNTMTTTTPAGWNWVAELTVNSYRYHWYWKQWKSGDPLSVAFGENGTYGKTIARYSSAGDYKLNAFTTTPGLSGGYSDPVFGALTLGKTADSIAITMGADGNGGDYWAATGTYYTKRNFINYWYTYDDNTPALSQPQDTVARGSGGYQWGTCAFAFELANLPPDAPTLVSPADLADIDATGGVLVDWTHNDPDANPQTEYSLRVQKRGR